MSMVRRAMRRLGVGQVPGSGGMVSAGMKKAGMGDSGGGLASRGLSALEGVIQRHKHGANGTGVAVGSSVDHQRTSSGGRLYD